MFTKSKAQPTSSTQGKSGDVSTRRGPPSLIAGDMRIQGDLETEGDVQIDGRVDGDLRTRTVTIGKEATVNGAITGETITIAGTVNGEIRGGSVILAETARVTGDIHHESLSIDAGAYIQGLCKRIADERPAPTSVSSGNPATRPDPMVSGEPEEERQSAAVDADASIAGAKAT